MRLLLAMVLAMLSGCSSAALTAARVTLAADEALLIGEQQFAAYDLAHQRALSEQDLRSYRQQQRPKVVAAFAALTAAAHEARVGVELAQAGRVETAPLAHALCVAVVGTRQAGAEVGWSLGPLEQAAQLCALVSP